MIEINRPSPRPPGAGSPNQPGLVHRRNLGLVLTHIATQGPCARTEIATGTGLSHSTVSAAVGKLIMRGLVTEDRSSGDANGPGRPRKPLRLAPRRALTIAVQIGHEQLRTAVSGLDGTPVWMDSRPYQFTTGVPVSVADAVAAEICRAEDRIRALPRTELARVLVAMPGAVADDDSRTVLAATNFGWKRPVQLGALLAARLPGLGCPIDIVNDANAGALAEYGMRPNRSRAMCYIAAGTGIGGGLILNHALHTGGRGIAGEPGHLPVGADGPACECGARGCLVLYAGPDRVLTRAGLADSLRDHGRTIALAELLRALQDRNPQARNAVHEAGAALGTAALAIAAMLDIDEIVLGGVFADWFPWLEPAITERIAGRAATVPAGLVLITRGILGSDAILTGAIELARRAVLDDPVTVPHLQHDIRTGVPASS
ncbi:ROK family protein [Nocardia sp. SYP-A9097]|uniref:ROK family transcriptional regulator n=1 Tax=Nocardia sp. SYP-A9097 TaxID=2663237 RepID=UPI00129BDFF1|nr:ROK family transcriptional regulator [Nocardia sp. SYP-A9097]MRH86644.1 ROK family protein [Nocardia sp. SYP-A9097]